MAGFDLTGNELSLEQAVALGRLSEERYKQIRKSVDLLSRAVTADWPQDALDRIEHHSPSKPFKMDHETLLLEFMGKVNDALKVDVDDADKLRLVRHAKHWAEQQYSELNKPKED